MFGRQQWTLFADFLLDQVRLSELFRDKIFVLILGLIFDTPLFTFLYDLKYWHRYLPLVLVVKALAAECKRILFAILSKTRWLLRCAPRFHMKKSKKKSPIFF
jgi:hypothetical protein